MKKTICLMLMFILLPTLSYSHGLSQEESDGMALMSNITEAIEKTAKERDMDLEKASKRFCDMLDNTIKMLNSVSEECKKELKKENAR